MLIYARYIAARIMGTLVLIAMSLTALIWLAQSLRFIDFIVNRGLNTSMFLYLSSLLIPSLLGIVLPIALFLAVLITYNKLTTESELTVLKSAGMSKYALIKPALIVAFWVMMAGYLISLYLLPTSYREFKDLQAFIRDNYVSVLLQEGVFNSPTKDLTVYVRKINNDGNLKGMLMHDRRDAAKPITMMAEEGRLVKTPSGPRFILINGNRQEIDHANNQLSLLYFDRYALDLSTFASKPSKRWREPEERYLNELFSPEEGSGHVQKLKAEGHNRITWPLYSVFFAMLALIPFIGGEFNRRGQWQRMLIVSCIALIAIGIPIFMKNVVAQSAEATYFMYVPIIGGILVCYFMIMRNHRPIKIGQALIARGNA